jgi:hypothetical protein
MDNDDVIERMTARFMASPGVIIKPRTIEASGVVWVTVHGLLCLALRHPEMTGDSRKIALEFVSNLGRGLVAWGILTADELTLVEQTEAEKRPGERG